MQMLRGEIISWTNRLGYHATIADHALVINHNFWLLNFDHNALIIIIMILQVDAHFVFDLLLVTDGRWLNKEVIT